MGWVRLWKKGRDAEMQVNETRPLGYCNPAAIHHPSFNSLQDMEGEEENGRTFATISVSPTTSIAYGPERMLDPRPAPPPPLYLLYRTSLKTAGRVLRD